MRRTFTRLTLRCFWLLLLCLGLGAVPARAQSDQGLVADSTELRALRQLYRGSGGDQWVHHDNWPRTEAQWAQATLAQATDWYGVTVDNGDVTQLNLDSNYLTGPLPVAVAALGGLRTFYLGSNPYQPGPLPAAYGQLQQLRHLNCNNAQLTGPLPAELGQLTQLEGLNLTGNALTGTLPATLGQLTNLQFLNLRYNQFNGSLPAELGQCTNLRYLYLGANQFTGPLPATVGQLTQLYDLDLSGNQFSGALPAALGNCQQLTYVQLSNNQLTGLPAALGACTALVSLDVSNNQLTGPLPPSLGQLRQLYLLSLNNNQLTGPIPPELGQLSGLQHLNLFNNQFSGPIPSTLGQLHSLLYCNLFNNQLSGAIPSALGGLTQVQDLNLFANQLTGPVPAELSQLRNLQYLNLNDNHLHGNLGPALNGLGYLQHLRLHDNDFTFGDLEPLFTGPNQSPRAGLFMYAPQLPPSGADTLRVNEGSPLRLASPLGGTHTHAQWQRLVGGQWQDIPGAQDSVLVWAAARPADEGSYRVRATNDWVTDLALTSRPRYVWVQPAVTGPRNWPDDTNQGLAVLRPHRQPADSAAARPADLNYVRTWVPRVALTDGYPGSPTQPGSVRWDQWLNLPGYDIYSLPLTKPADVERWLPNLEGPTNIGDDYGARLSAYLVAPQTGAYSFWVAGDDVCELWLSPDTDPTHRQRVAYDYHYTAQREWRRDSTQHSAPVSLVAGQRYYVEVRHKQGGGDNFVAAAWTLPDGSFEGPIAGAHLAATAHDEPEWTVEQASKTTQYLDGLGRPVQTVQHQATAQKRDLVQVQAYDALGREPRAYLPYVADTAGTGRLGYHPQPLAHQQAFYLPSNQAGPPAPDDPTRGVARTGVAYAETQFEASPLNRVTAQGAPGEAWRLTGGHISERVERPNTDRDSVLYFKPGYDPTSLDPGYQGFYAPGELWGVVVHDPHGPAEVGAHGYQTIEWKDKLGQVVLKQVEAGRAGRNDTSRWLRTSYVYDDFGHLRFVLQPESTKLLLAGQKAVDLPPGLQLRLPLDETAGSQALDASGHGLTGILSGGGSWLPTGGHDGGGALRLVDNQRLHVPLSWTPTAFTVSFWLNPSRRFDWSQALGADWGQFLFHSTANGEIYVGTDVPTRIHYARANTVAYNTWQHFVFTLDAQGVGTLYKNGQLLTRQGGFTPAQPWPEFVVGYTGDASYDEVQVYNRALSASEIGTLSQQVAPQASSRQAVAAAHPLGSLTREQWDNVPGSSIGDIPLSQPSTSMGMLSSLEGPTNLVTDDGNDFAYADRTRGYMLAPQDGAYTFWLASDDQAELWLSSDEDPTHKQRIAWMPGWSYPREWTRFAEQKSAAITLQQGHFYYLEVVHKEGGGGDNLAVTWLLPDGSQFGEPIAGQYLAPYGNAAGSTTNAQSLASYLFHYRYDGRGRQIAKQVPGQDGETLVVYDQLDRPVLSQDAQQRTRREWSWSKYDALGRVVLTGLVTRADTAGQVTLQHAANADTATTHQYEQRSADKSHYALGYTTDQAFPQLAPPGQAPAQGFTSWQALTASYYDDYDFDRDGQPDPDGHYVTAADAAFPAGAAPVADEARVTGLATRTLTRVLGVADNDAQHPAWLATTMFYDERGRVIQTQGRNARGGQDVVTLQLDFLGQPLRSVARHQSPSLPAPLQVVETMTYDHGERLLATTQQLPGEAAPVPLSRRAYNELGQLVVDTLATGGLQQPVKYAYNIRGWLTSLNNPYQPAPGDLFNLSLHYEAGFTSGYEQYNGNLTGQTWRGRDGVQRAYGYAYDPLNRLLQGDYVARTLTSPATPSAGAWSAEQDHYRLSFVSYDDNGNLQTLRRQGLLQAATHNRSPQYGLVDDLTYAYQGNRLLAVEDQVTGNQLVKPASYHGAPTSLAGDFQEGTMHQGQEYAYDAAGNLTSDKNKHITGIVYNHLNLPRQIHFGQGADSVVFRYTAAGQKVAKLVYQTGQATPQRTDYLGPYQYEGDSLRFFPHAAGRVLRFVSYDPARQPHVSYQREYTVKDHLGNLRLAYRAGQVRRLLATLEQDSVTHKRETQQFDSLSVSTPIAVSTTYSYGGGSWAARLNAGGSQPQPLGPLTQLAVQRGDTLKVSVAGLYPQKVSSGSTALSLLAFVADLLHPSQGNPPASVESGKRGGLPLLQIGLSSAALQAIPTVGGGVPRGYLRVLCFNADSALVYQRVFPLSQAAEGGFEVLGDTVHVSHDGYVSVYVGNESNVDVFFDQLAVEHHPGLQVQENQYDPWGLNLAGLNYQTPGIRQMNQYQFNGKERQSDLGLGWSDYGARFYDPARGAGWMSLDPLAEKMRRWSPFAFSFDNPGRFMDPDGMEANDFVKGKNGNIRWDNKANSQSTTKPGETYLGKTLTFRFNSYIDAKLWDGPNSKAPGDKLTSTVTLTGNENSKGELTSVTASEAVEVGKTPLGTARNYYPGLGSGQNKFDLKPNGSGVSLNFEQHASVSPIEEFGMGMMGYKIVNVAQKLDVNISRQGNVSFSSATDIFPSATLTLNGTTVMQYYQPSFVGTHSAPAGPTPVIPESTAPMYDLSPLPAHFYKR